MYHPARLIGLTAGLTLFSSIAMAQGSGTTTTETDVGNRQGSLSEKLNETSGVIHPEQNVDPGIHKEAPATGSMPVIRPPQSTTGGGSVEPK